MDRVDAVRWSSPPSKAQRSQVLYEGSNYFSAYDRSKVPWSWVPWPIKLYLRLFHQSRLLSEIIHSFAAKDIHCSQAVAVATERQSHEDQEYSSPRAHCKCNDPGIFVFVLILAMIQDHSLVASRHFLIETENTTTHYPKDGKDYDGGVLDGFTSLPKEQ